MVRFTKNINLTLVKTIIIFVLASSVTFATRIKDIASIDGVSGTQVIGYGLVTGLNNTGDNQRSTFTIQSVSNMLKRFGLTVPQTNPRIRNVAAVTITATIPPFSKKGAKVDIQVSSIGDATSLQGGILLMSPISTANGKYVGLAQGAISVGGYDYRTLRSRIGKNSVTAGRVPNALILEKDMGGSFIDGQVLTINLREPDFTTAMNIAEAINGSNAQITKVTPVDAGAVEVEFSPEAIADNFQLMQRIKEIEALDVQTDPIAKVVINERTGTIVVGGNVQLLPAVIAHGGLEISIQKKVIYPQQAPFTLNAPNPAAIAELQATEELTPAVTLESNGGIVQGPTVNNVASVDDMASALNALNVSARDLIAIFQALKEAGSLQGELVIQ